MENLLIDETKSTPYIDFRANQNIIIIKGQSYPENAFKFYEPIISWLEEFFKQDIDDKVSAEFRFSYINTSSSKCVMMILELFEEAFDNNIDIKLDWYYDEENEPEYECAEEFKEDYHFPFEIIPIKE